MWNARCGFVLFLMFPFWSLPCVVVSALWVNLLSLIKLEKYILRYSFCTIPSLFHMILIKLVLDCLTLSHSSWVLYSVLFFHFIFFCLCFSLVVLSLSIRPLKLFFISDTVFLIASFSIRFLLSFHLCCNYLSEFVCYLLFC